MRNLLGLLAHLIGGAFFIFGVMGAVAIVRGLVDRGGGGMLEGISFTISFAVTVVSGLGAAIFLFIGRRLNREDGPSASGADVDKAGSHRGEHD
jgi:hypothetical protein